jgi:PAS domain S-box-containing protein
MPAFAAQYQFAAAFTVFLVALAGLALVGLRGQPLADGLGARLALGAGFVGIGTAAFLTGSLLVEDRGEPAVLGLVIAGVLALVVGSFRWQGGSLSRALLWIGAAGLVLGAALEGATLSGAAAAVAALGALLIGAALLAASRRAVAARIAASAAATLLLVVLVLSVALSIVLGDTVEDQSLRDLDSRAVTEAGAIEAQTRVVARDAAQVATLLTLLPVDETDNRPVLAVLNADATTPEAQRQRVVRAIDSLRASGYPDTGFVYVSQGGEPVLSSGVPEDVVPLAAGAPAVAETVARRRAAESIVVRDGRAFAIGAQAVVSPEQQPLGAIVSVVPLDDEYLETRTADVSDDSLALATTGGVVASAGPKPDETTTSRLANELLGEGHPFGNRVTDDQLVAAQPVRDHQRSVLAVLTTRSTASVDASRERLFRTFFVIAFGGTVLALLLAALVGNRIGSGVRRLTTSAEALRRGELEVRSGVRSEDEVGVLGETFDSMAASIQAQTVALEESAARVEAIVDGMGEALIAIDGEGRITDFNHAAADVLALEPADAVGRPIDEVVRVAREDGSDLTPRLRSLEGGRWSELGDVVAADGDRVPVALTAAALHGPDGEVTGRVLVLRDLRGEREVERMKRHFLSRVGHELRTPLTPLIGYSQMLAGRELPPDRARFIHESILSSAKRLERIVEMLEFFASLDAGRQVLRAEPVDVRSLLTEVVDRRASAVSGTDHSVARRVARDTPRVSADRRWLGRSIDELVDNAVKFSPRGGRVLVSAGRSDADPSVVEIAVRDTGVGMSPDEVDAAFTEWAQGDESDTRSYGGLGLGLALVQRVTEHHGGRVVCTTAPGKGSTFAILLPALEEDSPPPSAARARRKRSPAEGVGEP